MVYWFDSPHGVVFFSALRRDSVFLFGFLFLIHVQVFSCENSLVCRLKCPYSCFSSHFCFLFIVVLLILDMLFLVKVNSLSWLFFLSLRDVLLMYLRYLQCWQVFFLLFFFLTHKVCLHHLWDVRLYAWSWVCMVHLLKFFSGPF